MQDLIWAIFKKTISQVQLKKKLANICLHIASDLNFLVCFIIKCFEGILLLQFFYSMTICIMIKR